MGWFFFKKKIQTRLGCLFSARKARPRSGRLYLSFFGKAHCRRRRTVSAFLVCVCADQRNGAFAKRIFIYAETVRRLFKLFSRRMLFLPKRLEKGGRFFRRKAALFPPVSFAHARFTEGKAQSADELFDIAVNESARLAELFCNCLKSGEPLPKTPFNLSFHSGKEE